MSTTQEQRPTPETDEAARKGAYFVPGDFSSTCGKQIVHIDFARKLERERDGLKEYAERCKQGCIKLSFAIGQIDYVCGEPNDMEVSDYCLHQNEEAVVERVKTKIAGLERERDEAREALSGRTVSCSQCNAAAAQIAALRKALEKALAVHKAITTYSLDQSLADREANEQHCAMMEKALSETRP